MSVTGPFPPDRVVATLAAIFREQRNQPMADLLASAVSRLEQTGWESGVDLYTLLKKRTEGLMQQHLQAGIERATRKEFPSGIEGCWRCPSAQHAADAALWIGDVAGVARDQVYMDMHAVLPAGLADVDPDVVAVGCVFGADRRFRLIE